MPQKCLREQEELAKHYGIHPEVVEAACLAHDLGHPPFGHAGEQELDTLVRRYGEPEGYEGNAQTFRIITKLAIRYGGEDQCLGLDLTRATMAACLKYPWMRNENDEKKKNKWSAYSTEADDFNWARQFFQNEKKTVEAEIMDWADDIAYSVHDLEDFHRVGIIPWSEILSDLNTDVLVSDVSAKWFSKPLDADAQIRDALKRIKGYIRIFPNIFEEKYEGNRNQRRQLRNFTSMLIGRYVNAFSLCPVDSEHAIAIDQESSVEVMLLKHIARRYVIGLPALHAQQFGQKRIIKQLFRFFKHDAKNGDAKFLPARFRYIWKEVDGSAARKAADCIALLTEGEAYHLYRRLTGYDSGSVLDPIVR
jgi:dGTPase